MDEEKLILFVQDHECLYNLAHPDYDNNLVKDNIWKEIGEKLKISANDCKNKWSTLRSYYRKARNRRKTVSGQSAKIHKKWRFEQQMEFLNTYLQDRETITNITVNVDNDGDSETNTLDTSREEQFSPTPSVLSTSSISSKKRKRGNDSNDLSFALTNYISAKKQATDVPEKKKSLMNFFQNIAETVYTLPEVVQAEVKRDIFKIVNDREILFLNESRNNANNTTFEETYVLNCYNPHHDQ